MEYPNISPPTMQRQPPSLYPERKLCMHIADTVLHCYGDDPTVDGLTKNMNVMWVNTASPKYVITIPLSCHENEHEPDDSENQDMVDISYAEVDDEVFMWKRNNGR